MRVIPGIRAIRLHGPLEILRAIWAKKTLLWSAAERRLPRRAGAGDKRAREAIHVAWDREPSFGELAPALGISTDKVRYHRLAAKSRLARRLGVEPGDAVRAAT